MSDSDLSNSIGPWFQFSDELRINALHLLNQPTLELGDAGLAQPKVFAAALLARTITNHKAVFMLLRAGLITEARTLTRSYTLTSNPMTRTKPSCGMSVRSITDWPTKSCCWTSDDNFDFIWIHSIGRLADTRRSALKRAGYESGRAREATLCCSRQVMVKS